MFKIIDISMTIEDSMPVYKNKEEKKPKIYNSSNFQTGKTHETRIDVDCHGGTHIDAPLHMLEDGATVETIGLEQLVGTCRVLDLTHVEDGITREDLEPHNLQKGEWVLLKTKNSFTDAFDPEFIYVKEDGARYLIEAGIRGVGIDSLGIERSQPEYTTHRPLFRNNIIIAEGLRLKDVLPGTYFMVIAPLKLTGIDGAPARAFLIANA
ncbi:cyclase family protein [Paenibacillus sambharensis]|uniref:Kynurenine formamidase n=1 Tax=Paenibacillus sambharensis TaxID=1803190 RepID=A0A2W1L214_9BACL|nr:cyclase family protein [Paenibacillus sambharensis]PZD92929.1 cyclase family protein [Paenibacillus sambharensis]